MATWFEDAASTEIRYLAADLDGQEFDHVFRVTLSGCVNGPEDVYAPEVHGYVDGDIHIDDAGENAWTALKGYTGQHGSKGSAVMHPSEYIGGNLAKDIIEMSATADSEGTPLLWTVVMLDDDGNDGWVVLHREMEEKTPHADYPHEAGRLHDCPACEAECHCGPGVAEGRETECVWSGHEQD